MGVDTSSCELRLSLANKPGYQEHEKDNIPSLPSPRLSSLSHCAACASPVPLERRFVDALLTRFGVSNNLYRTTAVFKMNARRSNMQFELRPRGKIAKFEESAGGLHKARISLLPCSTILLKSFRSHRLSKRSLEGREEKQVSMQTPTSPRSSTVTYLSQPRPQLHFKLAQHTLTTYL